MEAEVPVQLAFHLLFTLAFLEIVQFGLGHGNMERAVRLASQRCPEGNTVL